MHAARHPRFTLRVPADTLLRSRAMLRRFAGWGDFSPAGFRARRVSFPVVMAGLLLLALPGTPNAQAQRSSDFGMTYNQEVTRFVGDNPGAMFYLRGATIDYSADLWKSFGLSASGTGLAATNLRGFEDIHHVQFLVGPRYTWNWGHNSPMAWNRHGGIFFDGKIGYTFATSGIYPVNGVNEPHSSALMYEGGGGINVKIYHKFDLRLIEADYVRTQLPNGGTNVQNTIRVASGINFHFGR